MAEPLGDRLPGELVRALDDEAPAAPEQPAFLLVTTDEDGAPRIGMVGPGELLVRDERTLRVALWRGTRTARNLGRGGTALLGAVSPGAVIYVRVAPAPLTGTERLDCFELAVTSVEGDLHAGMPVVSGITFRVDVPDDWRGQRDALAGMGHR
jgi:hypothetical protein